ncbi:hypothetical protein, partial [Corynebacterium pseudodiphtheriticum]
PLFRPDFHIPSSSYPEKQTHFLLLNPHHVYHTPEKRLRGNRKAWFAVTGLVDVLGPVAFFLFGRKGKNKR